MKKPLSLLMFLICAGCTPNTVTDVPLRVIANATSKNLESCHLVSISQSQPVGSSAAEGCAKGLNSGLIFKSCESSRLFVKSAQGSPPELTIKGLKGIYSKLEQVGLVITPLTEWEKDLPELRYLYINGEDSYQHCS